MDDSLDSPQACIRELGEINRELAEFGTAWGRAAGRLASLEKLYTRTYKAAMRANPGSNADERSAIAIAAVEQVMGDDLELMDQLAGEVEECDKRFRSLDRRASNAQSILAALRDEARWEQVAPEGKTYGRRSR